jgi:hypothetical protein
LAYVDDVNISGKDIVTGKENTKTLHDNKDVGIEVNTERTRYVLMSSNQKKGQNYTLKIAKR